MKTVHSSYNGEPRGELACFGTFELNLSTGELRRRGQLVHLQPQPSIALRRLVQEAGALVSRGELAEALWQGKAVEEDLGLNACIRQVRRALGDRAQSPIFVETVPRHGYRFIARVDFRDGSAEGAHTARRPASRLPRVAWLLAAAALAALALTITRTSIFRSPSWEGLVAGVTGGSGDGTRKAEAAWPADTEGPPRLVVLPFTDLSSTGGHEFFADGLTEDLIIELANLQSLVVIARDSAVRVNESQASLADIARILRIDYALEGSVRYAQGRYRIAVQLIDASNETQLWAARFDRDQMSALDVQLEVAAEVARRLAPELDILVEPALFDPRAREHFLIARYLLHQGGAPNLLRAVENLELALEIEPEMAAAILAYGEASLQLGEDGSRDVYREAVLRSLELDPALAEAHLALGRMRLYGEWDFAGAEASYARAIELEPALAAARHANAFLLAMSRRYSEAIAELEQARELDPVSFTLHADGGMVYFMARRYDDAIAVCRRALELEPDNLAPVQCMFDAYSQQGNSAAAVEQARLLMSGYGASASDLARLDSGGQEERLRFFHEWQLAFLTEASASPVAIAAALLPLGEIERSLENLEQAYEQRSNGLLLVASDPRADAFDGDPRLAALIERIGIPVTM